MTGKTVALYLDHWADIAAAPATIRHPLALWRKAIWFKANPRSAAYMKERLAENWPDAAFIDVDADPGWDRVLAEAGRVVLLYPDAIGLGWDTVERRVMRRMSAGTIEVLNGRRRVFTLDRATRRRLRLRRRLERSMIAECAMGALMLIATPFLYGVDLLRGRR